MATGRWFIGLCMVVMVGCQSAQKASHGGLDNAKFMDLWNVYHHCQSLTDVDLIKADSALLSAAQNHPVQASNFVLPLPGKLDRFISGPSVRLAVDVNAMAAACTLRTGQLAFEAGRLDLAKEMFHTVVRNHPHPDYAYYTRQARAGLHQIDSGFQITLQLP